MLPLGNHLASKVRALRAERPSPLLINEPNWLFGPVAVEAERADRTVKEFSYMWECSHCTLAGMAASLQKQLGQFLFKRRGEMTLPAFGTQARHFVIVAAFGCQFGRAGPPAS